MSTKVLKAITQMYNAVIRTEHFLSHVRFPKLQIVLSLDNRQKKVLHIDPSTYILPVLSKVF